MNIRNLWYFLWAASSGGPSAGARTLRIAQSTMSGAIGALEAEMNSRLFDPTPAGMKPTAAAIRLRDYALWLLLETEQALLDLQAGNVGSTERIPIFAYGVPRGSLTDWAILRGTLRSVARNGRGASLVIAETVPPERIRTNGVVARYHLVANSHGQMHLAGVADGWSAISMRDNGDSENEIAWNALSDFRLIVQPLPGVAANTWRDAFGGAAPDVSAIDPCGAPFTLLERKDAVLLLPTSSLPAGYAVPRVKIMTVTGAPVTPVLEIEAVGEVFPGKIELVRHLRHELTAVVAGGGSQPPRIMALEKRIDLHTLRCFLATMETGNTSRAAQACFIVQPALSGQIRKLEKSLSRQLFDRSRSGMTPTAAGRRLHGFVEPILGDHATARERLREGRWSGQRKARVRLGIIPAASEDSLIAESAADALAGWRGGFPDTPISVAEGYTSVLFRWLRTHLIDLAIIDTTESQPGLEVIPIFRESIALVFAPGSVWDTGDSTINGADLLPELLAIPSKRFGLRALFDKAFAEVGIVITPNLEVDSMAIVLRLLRNGDWATILPPSAVHRQLSEGSLKRRLLRNPSIERRICAAQRSQSRLHTETTALLDELNLAFGNRISSSDLGSSSDRSLLPAMAAGPGMNQH